jgi:UDP-N-acetyl-D-mannosaminuronate dehydrogenase
MIKGFRMFQRTSSPRVINLASYHDPRSLTWSWILSLAREEQWHFGFYPSVPRGGWCLRVGPWSIQWQAQEKMLRNTQEPKP